MISRSYTNLLDLASGNFPVMGRERSRRLLPRVMTVPGNVSEFDDDDQASSDNPSSVSSDRMIIVANRLPLKAERLNGTWSFAWDQDSLYLQLKDGFPEDMEVLYVGSLSVDVVGSHEQEHVAQILLEKFKCVPAFFPPDLQSKFYHGFCKRQLWPLFHYMLPFSPANGGRFDRSMWEAYVAANKLFFQKNSINKAPSQEVMNFLAALCEDKKNSVFIVSGRGRESLGEWFSPCRNIGIAAEHGYFLKWPGSEKWETCGQGTDFGWMQIVEPVMKQYTESTDGSSIEVKDSALVWQYRDADPGFVKSGHYIVEVKPQGVSKGYVSEKIFSSMAEEGKPVDFVLCIGDDRSDEDMFEAIVGQKPSKAKYYLDDTMEVRSMLESLAEASEASNFSMRELDDAL
ncbi:BnaC05g04390D [Brassica napus]|uniref:BnaC05g04390D protein n=1 Tax=Brassica napus TaxID=3708 RepID=A0A078FA01_BRANA|nr:BnaC05g04390D [Brassica napus]